MGQAGSKAVCRPVCLTCRTTCCLLVQAAPGLAQALQGRKGFVDKLLDGADMMQGSGLQWYFKRQVRGQGEVEGVGATHSDVCWGLGKLRLDVLPGAASVQLKLASTSSTKPGLTHIG
jgi:hypothetical protein